MTQHVLKIATVTAVLLQLVVGLTFLGTLTAMALASFMIIPDPL
ncbi:MAG: hypothetical protein AB7O70_11020 [Hyphomicrobiales bacterium]